MGMDERLEDIVTQVLEVSHQPLSRTALMKLLYFIDLRSYEQRGRGVTGLDWKWHHFGPFAKAVYDVLNRMEARSELAIDVVRTFYGSPEYRIQLGDGWGYYQPLDRLDSQMVDNALREFGQFGPQRLAELSYYTWPMQQVKQRGDRLDFTAYSDSRHAPPVYELDPRVPAPSKMKTG